ncbi:arsenic resistance N-acetyltransferase ArsN2 [Longitalea arenae]|uniref:arsenic resistance N-acetyltransferase ArsN2 n=1 Tax=Longitalea arenae TaxID=2812558 RepID=UPI001966F82B|nr:arsenic resistance N-acetyltransferase ArsN2 [Longitalea arenae]
MQTDNQTNIVKASDNHRPLVIALLQAEKLPVENLPTSLDNFFVARHNNKVVGAIGLELYGDYALLRSMVVSTAYRNNNIASRLVEQVEAYGRSLGITSIYLLTETAPGYFEKKGYQKINRDEVPAAVQLSSEFGHVCPVSAIVMKKNVNP